MNELEEKEAKRKVIAEAWAGRGIGREEGKGGRFSGAHTGRYDPSMGACELSGYLNVVDPSVVTIEVVENYMMNIEVIITNISANGNVLVDAMHLL